MDAPAERWPAEARRALVEDFLASPQAAKLRDPIARTVPHLLAMCCVGHLRVRAGADRAVGAGAGPAGRAAEGGDRAGSVRQAVPQAVRAWIDWLAERNKLADRSRRRLVLHQATFALSTMRRSRWS